MWLDQIADVHWANSVLAAAYAILAIVAIGTGVVAVRGYRQQTQSLKHQQRDYEYQVRVHREKTRIDAYIEIVAALSAARSAGRRWHNTIRDTLLGAHPDAEVVGKRQLFNSQFSSEVLAEASKQSEERDRFYEMLDELWTARAKIQLVGTKEVSDAAKSILDHYDPRVREFAPDVVKVFGDPRRQYDLNPGYPLAGSSERREAFMKQARSELNLLEDELEDVLQAIGARDSARQTDRS
jgi:hypothetical protein